MVRQLPPPHLKTAGPTAPPPHHRFSTETTSSVVVNHYTGADKLIPAIPGFRTSAGKFSIPFSWLFPVLLFMDWRLFEFHHGLHVS